MNKNFSRSTSKDPTYIDLISAVEAFVANGGVIAVIPDDETADAAGVVNANIDTLRETEAEVISKVELLKSLVAKGAGFSALQYSLRMNRKDIRKLAIDHGVRIHCSRPVEHMERERRHGAIDIDDRVAGHVMHYSSLGYTASEIAQVLDLSLRQVWNIGKAYRLELRQVRNTDIP
ncbi:hypothetical protein [Pseudomonas sp. CDFA 610]|uniref:hypothetical protein n=1 Tax=Pseudomonas sp. CDFA 610 TaxID=2829825 RepID=UPI001E4327BA|nr:hypothetical protein [Pseudomonas sp. CDFA 610]MCD5984730.1 hypothetical protein [Pseudomonas sp. CDFA 610]